MLTVSLSIPSILSILLLLVAYAATYTHPAHADQTSAFAVQVTDPQGRPLAGIPVTLRSTTDRALLALQTNANGIATFDNLPAGEWQADACGQSLVYGSTDGNTGGLWLVTCARLWLPVAIR